MCVCSASQLWTLNAEVKEGAKCLHTDLDNLLQISVTIMVNSGATFNAVGSASLEQIFY